MSPPVGASVVERLTALETGLEHVSEKLDDTADDVKALAKDSSQRFGDIERKIDRLTYLGLAFAVVGGVINEKTLSIFTSLIGG